MGVCGGGGGGRAWADLHPFPFVQGDGSILSLISPEENNLTLLFYAPALGCDIRVRIYRETCELRSITRRNSLSTCRVGLTHRWTCRGSAPLLVMTTSPCFPTIFSNWREYIQSIGTSHSLTIINYDKWKIKLYHQKEENKMVLDQQSSWILE